MTGAILLAGVVGAISAFWIDLHVMYQAGYETGYASQWIVDYWGGQTWGRLHTRISSPQPPDVAKMGGYLFGALFTMFLSFMRVRFLWWPLHPAGFLAGTCFGVMRMWLPMLFAASAKAFLLRYGGLEAYRKAAPFFIGLIAGEFTVGLLVSLLTFWMHLPQDSGIGGL